MLTLDKIKLIDIPLNVSRKKNNFGPASQGLVLYNDSVNLYKALQIILDDLGVGTPSGDEAAQDAVGNILVDTASINFTYNDGTPSITADVLPAGVDHDSLLNWVANKHIDHSTVSITSGTGLTGGGDITASRVLSLDNTTVVAGSYGGTTTIPTFTVNAQGQLTAAASVPISITTSQITNINETIYDQVDALLVAGTGINLVYDDGLDTLTISSTTTGTVTSVAASAPVSGFAISGSPITSTGTFVFTLNDDLLAVESLATTGIAARTAASTWATRTITGTASNISVADGDGVAGDPTIDLIATAVTPGSYGSAATVPAFTVDAYGRLTLVTDVPINILASQILNFTEEVQDIAGAAIVAGTDISVTYDDLAGTITIGSTFSTGALDEIIDDRVAALLVAGTNVTLTYDDGANTLTIDAAAGTVSGSGGPYEIPYWNLAATELISDSTFTFDGVRMGINTPSTATNCILTTQGLTTSFLSLGYSHLDSTGDIAFYVADDGSAVFGNFSSSSLTVSATGISRDVGYTLSTGAGNLTMSPTGITYFVTPVGINTSSVGSNKLRVEGSVRFNLGSDGIGDVFYRGASGDFTRLAAGTNGDVLTLASGIPAWIAAGSASLPAGSSGDIMVHNGTSYVSVTPITETQSGITGTAVTLASAPETFAPFTLYRNGVYQVITDDYTYTGTALTMVQALVATDKITAIYHI